MNADQARELTKQFKSTSDESAYEIIMHKITEAANKGAEMIVIKDSLSETLFKKLKDEGYSVHQPGYDQREQSRYDGSIMWMSFNINKP